MKTFLMFVLLLGNAHAFEIEVKLHHLSSDKGDVHYLLFPDGKGFPDKENASAIKGTIPAKMARERFIISGISKGDYALSLFHDVNKNGKLDTNFIGIPKEAFGFSNNPRIYFGPPSFKKAKFFIDGDAKVDIEMKEI